MAFASLIHHSIQIPRRFELGISSAPPAFSSSVRFTPSPVLHVPLLGDRCYCSIRSPRMQCLKEATNDLKLSVSNKKETEAKEVAGETTTKTTKVKELVIKTNKAPAKPLPEMMEENIIPALRAAIEAHEGISLIDLSFQENRLEGSFLKKDKPYYFWAFFPNGDLTGPKGFSLSSYGLEASTIEPFLIDERKITDKHVVFWVRKRLAAQGILPVWKD